MNVFDYEKFLEAYDLLKKTIGSLGDKTAVNETKGDETIGGVIDNSNSSILSGLKYAEGSKWASTKLEDWEKSYPNLVRNYENLVNLLANAKNAADKYNEWEQNNQGF